MTEDLNWDYREQSQLAVRVALELGASELQVKCSNHSATLPRPIPKACSIGLLFCFPFRAAPRYINAQRRLQAEILDSNPKGDDIFLICRVALLTVIVVVVVVVSLITEGIISSKLVNDFILFCCYQVSQILVGKPFMTQLHLM